MAAPWRSACFARHLRWYCYVLKPDPCVQYQFSANAWRHYANKAQDDFYGIEADLQSSSEGPSEATSADSDGVSSKDLGSVLAPLRRRRKKSMEVRLETAFGEVRLDKTARQPYLETLQPEQFWKIVHSRQHAADTSDSRAVKERAGENNTKQERRRKSGDARPRSDTEARQLDTEHKAAAAKTQLGDDHNMNYFDEVYFAQSLMDDSQKRLNKFDTSDRAADQIDRDGKNVADSVSQQPGHLQRQHTVTNHPSPSPESVATDSFFDESYFSTVLERERPPASQTQPQSGSSYIDDQYFPDMSSTDSVSSKPDTSHTNQRRKSSGTELAGEEFSYIDAQFMATPETTGYGHSSSLDHMVRQYNGREVNETGHLRPPSVHEEHDYRHLESHTVLEHQLQPTPEKDQDIHSLNKGSFHIPGQRTSKYASVIDENTDYVSEQKDKVSVQGVGSATTTRQRVLVRGQLQPFKSDDAGTPQHKEKENRQSARARNVRRKPHDGETETAFDVAMKIRKEFRTNTAEVNDERSAEKRRLATIKEQTPDICRMPSIEITRLLADSVIYENEDFLALSKPYGLPSHGGPGVRVSVGQLLEPLAQSLDKGRGQLATLHLVHRLDKETTGIMLLAKNAEVAWQLLGMFRRREVKKTYWAVTKGVPQPLEGIIDIPLTRQKVHGIFKTMVKPESFVAGGEIKKQQWSRREDRSQEAVTAYAVLAHHDSMALVELWPTTGIQHQIRAHLAQGLNAPILGDHKYSHHDKLAPQRLFPEALQKLGIRQAQVRYLPMHLHAKSLVLPEWRGRHNIFINCPIPKYFLRNLKTLKIKIPKV